ncbi:MAG: DUF3198 domain-containing protein [Candidatus Thermoplasmatota archaeon]|nr:DUF3198 domain-containing protein [Candidatus Thermoplasmatota archaeon]
MLGKIREYQFLVYLLLLCVSVLFFIISMNDQVFHNQALIRGSVTLNSTGSWIYWILALSFIFSLFFGYETYTVLKDTRSFYSLIKSDSKHSFVKNLKELERIAGRLGPMFSDELHTAKEKWKVR